MKKRPGSFEIALSAISCAIAVSFLWLGILGGFLKGLGYLMGILALMLPLSKRFYAGGFLAYAGTCILTLVLGAVAKFWDLVPFIMFFGLHPIVNSLQLKYNVNKYFAFIVKCIWFIGTLFVGYFLVFGGVLGGSLFPQELYDVINRYIYVIIPVGGALIFLIYDFLIFRMQQIVDGLVYRIRK